MSFKGVVSVQVKGIESVAKLVAAATEKRRKAAVDELNKGAFAIHAWIVADMNKPKSGNVSARGIGTHTASAPGESPARDSGELVRKLRVDLANVQESDPTAQVISAADYAAALEFGTERVAARPYMRPGFAANIQRIRARVKAALGGKS